MARKRKAAKPYKDFPLFLHATGQWAKKIKGKMHYFGKDAAAAEERYQSERKALHAGLPPGPTPGAVTVMALANRFLTSKRLLVDSGELSPRTWRDYHGCCELLLKHLGKRTQVSDLTSEHFERLRSKISKHRGPVSLGNEVQRIRTVFKFAFEDGQLVAPVRFGAMFRKPSRKVMRRVRNAAGPKMFTAAEVRKLIQKAAQPMKAMILLGINCGFGNHDVASLPASALDLKAGWANFPRPKTETPRRVPLWPETVKAIRAAIAKRPKAKKREDAGLVFITKYGWRWVRVREREGKTAVPIDSVCLEFNKLLTQLGFKRPGLGFYALRHTFRTVADGSKDQVAVNSIMGHTDESMAARYREGIDDQRLKDVTDTVRSWLFPAEAKK